jgi:hypothetical protein
LSTLMRLNCADLLILKEQRRGAFMKKTSGFAVTSLVLGILDFGILA